MYRAVTVRWNGTRPKRDIQYKYNTRNVVGGGGGELRLLWCKGGPVNTILMLAVSSSPRPWMDVYALPEKSNMAVTESDLDSKVRKMSITF